MRIRHLLQSGLLAILISVLIIACQNSSGQNLASQSSLTKTENCRIVQHDAGETEICGQPQTVAALSPRVLDPMLALNVQPAAYAESAYEDRSMLNLDKFDNPRQQIPHLGDWITTQPVNLGDRGTPSLETLVKVNPDLIVVETWEANETLSKIAPMLVLNGENGKDAWSRRLQVIAQAFGKEEQAAQVITQYEEKLAEVGTKLAPVRATYPRVLIVGAHSGLFYIQSYSSDVSEVLEESGFQLVLPDGMSSNSSDALQISIEALAQLDPDIIIVLASNKSNVYNPEPAVKRQWDTPLLQKIRAIQEGRIIFVNGYLWGGTRSGPISYNLMLAQLPDLLLPLVEE